jgi:hypothetical protein
MPFACRCEPERSPIRKGASRRDLIDWRAAEAARTKQERKIRPAVMRIFGAMQSVLPVSVIAEALRSGRADDMIDRIPSPDLPAFEPASVPAKMRKASVPLTPTGLAISSAATAAEQKEVAAALSIRTAIAMLVWASGESVMTDLGASFSLLNPAAAGYLETRTAALVTEIGASTREAIRETVAQLYLEGGSAQRLARRVKPLIGLRSDQLRAVLRRSEALAASGVSAAAQDRAIAAYGRKLLRQRATLIARTETIFAQAAGQDIAFREGIERGLVLAGSVRVWIADPGERTCPICEALDGAEAPIGGTFESSEGNFDLPPAHPACRCAVVLETR